MDLNISIFSDFPLDLGISEWFEKHFGHCKTKNITTKKKHKLSMCNPDSKFNVRFDIKLIFSLVQ